IAVVGQTADLVPADKRLYGLRDVTATVDNVSLIAASIMSKKIAAGADAIVLDVKVGDGAFMKTLDDARVLAETMIALGRQGKLGTARFVGEVVAPRGGFVRTLAALPVGLAALHLGAGRREKEEPIDPTVGIVCVKKRGDAVDEGEPLAEIHARDKASADAVAESILGAYEIGDDPPPARPIVLDTLA